MYTYTYVGNRKAHCHNYLMLFIMYIKEWQ